MQPTLPSETLPDALRSVLDNGIPALMATCSGAGVPNITVISQVYYVDSHHVAVSFQFFNKTVRNIRENPRAEVCLNDPEAQTHWILELEFLRSEKEGPIFEAMEIRIEAIASATGMAGIFKLMAADIYRVRSWRRLAYGARPEESG